jgi:hypothetical protein
MDGRTDIQTSLYHNMSPLWTHPTPRDHDLYKFEFALRKCCVNLSFSGFVVLEKILEWPPTYFYTNFFCFEEDLKLT